MRNRGKIYPVLGVYPYSFVGSLAMSIEKGTLRMTELLREQQAHYIDFENDWDDQFLNINTPENFRTAERAMYNITG